jgi:hypothetical protein
MRKSLASVSFIKRLSLLTYMHAKSKCKINSDEEVKSEKRSPKGLFSQKRVKREIAEGTFFTFSICLVFFPLDYTCVIHNGKTHLLTLLISSMSSRSGMMKIKERNFF